MLMRIDDKDNVAVVLADGKRGDVLKCGNLTIKLLSDIPFGHKCALQEFNVNDLIIKYGHPIGYATEKISCGEIVRENNMKGLRGRGDI